MFQLHGIVPPVVTPLDRDGQVDPRSLTRLVEYLLDNGVHGLFALGSSGEGPVLDSDERATVIRTIVAAARGRVPVLVGVMSSSFNDLLRYVDMARDRGADAVVTTPTFYYSSNQVEALRLFRMLRQRSALPVVAYNLPILVKTGLDAATLATLAQEGTIAGIKDSSGDLSATREMFLAVREVSSVPVLTGLEYVTDLALAMGLPGAVPGLGNVAPRAYVDIYTLVQQGEFEAARRIQENMIRLFCITRQGRSGQSHSDAALGGFKTALKVLGVIETNRMHAPMQSLNEKEEDSVRAILQETGLL